MPLTRFRDLTPGYPQLAALLSKENGFAVFRKFSTLNVRSLLYLQAELTALEQQLAQTDNELLKVGEEQTLKSWQRFSSDQNRADLVRKIRETLHEYNTTLAAYDQVLHLASPTRGAVTGLRRWTKLTQPITDPSQDFLNSKEVLGDRKWSNAYEDVEHSDLASLNRRADSWLANKLPMTRLRLLFLRDWIYYDEEKQLLSIWPDSRVEKFVNMIVVLAIVVLSVSAIMALHFERRNTVRLGLVGVFTLLLAAIMALCGARKAEIMMGTVGYVAVLVVFLSGHTT